MSEKFMTESAVQTPSTSKEIYMDVTTEQYEAMKAGVALLQRPIDPTDLVVVAPRVVVSLLRAQELVAGQEHRHALREHQRRHHVLRLPLP